MKFKTLKELVEHAKTESEQGKLMADFFESLSAEDFADYEARFLAHGELDYDCMLEAFLEKTQEVLIEMLFKGALGQLLN